MAKIFSGANSSQLYLNTLVSLMSEGDEVSPRGKAVKELRPVTFEFTNPLNRVTFVKGRKVNPFFQLAEALWILEGRADVEWLVRYNKNMAEFSDDGVTFNAPYGERLRYWNYNSYRSFVYCPINQLEDVYNKFQKDIHTRQAVALIYNPLFDSADYGGKDTPCNIALFFKVRNSKLHLTVVNRSNDIHWGVFGANIVQFSTIQEAMASWLGIEVGTYCQITDSLHVYLDAYGAKETEKIQKAYGIDKWETIPEVHQFQFENEPRMTLGFNDFYTILDGYFQHLDPIMNNDEVFSKFSDAELLLENLKECPDAYIRQSLLAMFTYRAHRLEQPSLVLLGLDAMEDDQWKLSCLFFLYNKYKDLAGYKELYTDYSGDKKAYIEGA